MTSTLIWKRALELQPEVGSAPGSGFNAHFSMRGRPSKGKRARENRRANVNSVTGEKAGYGGTISLGYGGSYNSIGKRSGSRTRPNVPGGLAFSAIDSSSTDAPEGQCPEGQGPPRSTRSTPAAMPIGGKVHQPVHIPRRACSTGRLPREGPKQNVRPFSPHQTAILTASKAETRRVSWRRGDGSNLRTSTSAPAFAGPDATPSTPLEPAATSGHGQVKTVPRTMTSRDAENIINQWSVRAETSMIGQTGKSGTATRSSAGGGGRVKDAREATMGDLERDNARKETTSAKRKAKRYKTCLLEAQVGTTVEHSCWLDFSRTTFRRATMCGIWY